MITRVIKIGNSRGIRIPKSFIEQSGLEDIVELKAEKGKIILSSVKERRKNWDLAFKKMSDNNDDKLLDENALLRQSSWDDEEWTW